jgi:hypothetical protein
VNRKIAFPFLTLPYESVTLGQWLVGDPGEPLVGAKDILDGWDYARDLELSVDIEIDFKTASASLAIEAEYLGLEAIFRVGTGVGAYPRKVITLARHPLTIESPSATMTGIVRSSQLSGRLQLQVSVVLAEVPKRRGRLSPGFAAARLWSETKDILLEDGGQGRFPLESVSFSEIFAGRNYCTAPWYLLWHPDTWDTDVSGALRLYINSDCSDFQKRIVQCDRLALQIVMADVAKQLIVALLNDSDAADHLDEYSDGTVGAQVRQWLERMFSGSSLEVVRSELAFRPGQFYATVLAGMELGELI